ncbi:MAG: DNA polymerase III subunit beta [Alphaproteobacteria bacterium]|jgi:DNA polymerase-3 subunit beta|nr:DNA polymerase III subunit beta [Alphaproteobacteria bacterium]
MKLTIERSVLLRSLSHAQSVVERRTTIPILSNVLLVTEDGSLRLTATDLDIAIVEEAPAEVQEPGGTTVSAHTLYDIVRKLPDGGQVGLAYDAGEGRLKLSAGRSEFALACLPREDFPAMSDDELPHRFQLDAGVLKRLIEKTRFAISTEETRYYLNGIYLHAKDVDGTQVMRAVATDGHRLARVEMPLPEGASGMAGIIVPRKAVVEVEKLLEDADDTVDMALSDTRIRFTFASTVITSKLIDGTFPDYERVIPAGNDKKLEVDGKSFASAVDRVSTISSEKSRAVKLALDQDRLVLSANSPESGSATEEMPVAFSAGDMEIGFNSRYLLDITSQIEGEQAEFLLADAASPTIIRDVGDESALYVLMPMRV